MKVYNNNKFAIIDALRYPVIRINAHNPAPTGKQIEAFFQEFECAACIDDRPFVSIHHVPTMFLAPNTVQRIARLSVQFFERHGKRNAGVFVVVNSPIARKIFKLFKSVVQGKIELVIVASEQQALELAQTRLQQATVQVA